MDDAKPERTQRGAPEPVLKVDLAFEEAIRRLVNKPVPPEGLPDFRVRERASPRKPRKP